MTFRFQSNFHVSIEPFGHKTTFRASLFNLRFRCRRSLSYQITNKSCTITASNPFSLVYQFDLSAISANRYWRDPRPRVIINCSFNSHVRNGPTVHPIDNVCPPNPGMTFTRVKLSPSLLSILSFIFIFVVFETGCHDEFVVLLRLRLRFRLVKGRTFRFPSHWCASMQPVCKVLHP